MTVGELIKDLQAFDEDRIVILAKDEEGNGFSPLADLDPSSYKADNTYSGEVGLEELTPELIAAGYSEEDVLEGQKALVLWPIN